ncbi:hypothetical protein GA0115246_105174 [Streptomyces sp. SolWspMP-sol7th]|nr:hypothetical protein GA0115246_105174 [Streptomyces sp. SolWspMP-sol7th]
MPAVDCSCEVRGRSTPTERNAAWVRPEQSHEWGPVPPMTYASPTCDLRKAMTLAAEPLAGAPADCVEAVDVPEPVDVDADVDGARVVRAAEREAVSRSAARFAAASSAAFFFAAAFSSAFFSACLRSAFASLAAFATAASCSARSS